MVTDVTDLKISDMSPENYVSFWALILSEHLATAPRNATYTSSGIQNQLIEIIGNQIRNKILDRVKRAQWFMTYFSNKEQLSLVLRYVDPDTALVREDLSASLNVTLDSLVAVLLTRSWGLCRTMVGT